MHLTFSPAYKACWMFDEGWSKIFHWLFVCKATSSKNSWLRVACHILIVNIEWIWVRVSADISGHSPESQQSSGPEAGYVQGGSVAKGAFLLLHSGTRDLCTCTSHVLLLTCLLDVWFEERAEFLQRVSRRCIVCLMPLEQNKSPHSSCSMWELSANLHLKAFQLSLDCFTPQAIMLLFPLQIFFIFCWVMQISVIPGCLPSFSAFSMTISNEGGQEWVGKGRGRDAPKPN